MTDTQARRIATKIGFDPNCLEQAVDVMMKLYKVFMENDASLIEINPFSEDASGKGDHYGIIHLHAAMLTVAELSG